jgi:uncharacterized protein YcbK (DUF882 family)
MRFTCASAAPISTHLASGRKQQWFGTSLIQGPLVLALIAGAVLQLATRSRGLAVRTDNDPLASVHTARPVLIVPAIQDAVSEPSLPFQSFARLAPIHVLNINTLEAADVRLYDVRGEMDRSAIETLERLLCDATKPDDRRCAPMDARVVQLMFKAAYHFRRGEIVLVSGYREPRKHDEGFHSAGRAIDFRLTGVELLRLSAYVRSFPRAGVGVYTHPRTQYVHVDTRDRSYQWGDASGPGIHGGEWSLGGEELLAKQDASYTSASDWPEGTRPPARPAGK